MRVISSETYSSAIEVALLSRVHWDCQVFLLTTACLLLTAAHATLHPEASAFLVVPPCLYRRRPLAECHHLDQSAPLYRTVDPAEILPLWVVVRR